MTKVLGIDGGMTRLGLGAIDTSKNPWSIIQYGLIANPWDRDLEKFNPHLNDGIRQITIGFPKFLDMVRPTLIISETIPVGRLGSNDALVIAAITTCKVIATQFGIEWFDIAAVTVKKQLTGNYKATKPKVRDAVFELYPDVERKHLQLKREEKERGEKMVGLPFDVFDALAVATIGARLYATRN